MGVAELANPGAQGAGKRGTGLVELHHVSDVCEFGEFELVGEPAEFRVRGLLFQAGAFQGGPDMDEERYIAESSGVVQCLGGRGVVSAQSRSMYIGAWAWGGP
jgi:hypothetical protein